MDEAHQTCRVCGVVTPAGFTHCDICYEKINNVSEPMEVIPQYN